MNKTTVVIILLLFSLLFGLVFVSSKSAYALGDPMTISQIASLAYGLGSSFGITFDMSGLTAAGANDFYSNRINSWLAGRSIAEAFGVTPAQIVAGKLIIPHLLYNGIREFLNSFVTDNGISEDFKQLYFTSGGYSYSYNGIIDYPEDSSKVTPSMNVVNLATGETELIYSGGFSKSLEYDFRFAGILVYNNRVCAIVKQYTSSGRYVQDVRVYGYAPGATSSDIGASISGEIPETVLNPDQEWSGTIGGQDWPDTNLDELLGSIDQGVIDGTLDVEGEIVEPVVPPTPVPTVAPDIPLQDVPWEGLNDLIGSSTDTISEGIQDQTDAITGAQEETTEAVESLTETIEGVLDAPSTEDLPDFKFDLRELFPFCIPFDIYRLLSSFDAEPQAPHVQLPIVIQSIGFNYTLDLDFSSWNPVAQAMRTAELVVYGIALAWATGKVIKW